MKKRKLIQTDFYPPTVATKLSVVGDGIPVSSQISPGSKYEEHEFPRRPLSTGPSQRLSPGSNRMSQPGARVSPGPCRAAAAMDPAAEQELRRVIDNFVTIYEQLDKCEGPHVKPNYSYTELAYLAMLRAPNFCLPITEIYRYIQSRFLFFKNSTRKHWKNAVRHSLAKTMCFSKIPRGKGACYSENLSRSQYLWCIIPNSITSFARGDYRPGVDKESGTNTLRWGFYRVNAGQFWDQVGDYIAVRMDQFKESLNDANVAGQVFESQVCVLPNSTPTATKPARQPLIPMMPQKNDVVDTHIQQQHKSSGSLYPQCTSPLPVHSQVYLLGQPKPEIQISHQTCQKQFSPIPVHDPWLPQETCKSPDTSVCSVELSNNTPPRYNGYDSRDSGHETCNSSPEGSYYNSFYQSCSQQQNNTGITTPPQPLMSYQCRTPCDDEFDQIELSPFGETDISQLCSSIDDSYGQPKFATSPNECFVSSSGRSSCKFSTPVMSPTGLFQQPCQMMNNDGSPFSTSNFDINRSFSSPLYNFSLESELNFPAIVDWSV